MPPTALVTGGSGAVGTSVVDTLQAAGYDVRTLTRRQPLALSGVDAQSGDIRSESDAARACRNVQVVFHLAAHVHQPPGSDDREYESINVLGTRTILTAAVAAGVERFVYFSTVNVYGPTGVQAVDETAPVRPSTSYARTKLDAEYIVLRASEAAPRPFATILRLAAVYGSGVKGNYDTLVKLLARGLFIPIGTGANHRTLVHSRDAAAAAWIAATHPAAVGRIFNVTDGRTHAVARIIQAITAALGRREPLFAIPAAVGRACATIGDTTAQLLRRSSPGLRERVEKYLENVAVSGDLMRRELRFEPQYDLDAGWREAIQDMRRRGVL